ncbi:MAG: DUF998 domain-containing protein, partial [Spirochaetes bacterium]|nr:DUF998 domain-containing protein [Spirochaetota bacterium]
MNYQHAAGVLLFIGAVQFVLGMLIAEFLYPGYSASMNYISDLGATCRTTCIIYQPSASIFNTSVSLLGVLALVSSYFIWREFHNRLISLLLGLSGVGMVGVGLFPETAGIFHLVASFIAFFFGGLSAIATYKLVKAPFAYLSVLMGMISLIALALFISEIFLGLGPGGMERMIAYPLLLWVIGFGGN